MSRGYFLVVIETDEGQFGYHYKNEFWEYFEIDELSTAKKWDGHISDDVWRLLSLLKKEQDL